MWGADPASNKNSAQYVNGVSVTATTGGNPGFGSGGALSFGARQDGARPVVADIFNVRLYDCELTPEDILFNYNIDRARFGLT